jgi:hypothetical protein
MINSFDRFDFVDCSVSKWREDDLDANLEDVVTHDESDDGTHVKHSPKRYHNKQYRIQRLSYDGGSDRTSP